MTDPAVADFLDRNRHLIPAGDTDWHEVGCRCKEAFWSDRAKTLVQFWDGREETPWRDGILDLWENVAANKAVLNWHDDLLKRWDCSLEERFVHWLLTSPQIRLPGTRWDEADGMPETSMKTAEKLFERAMARIANVYHISAKSRASFYRIANRLRLLEKREPEGA